MIAQRQPLSMIAWTIFCLSALATISEVAAQERGSRWDPASFLQRLDRNGNGTLEQEEMVGRARGFIENLGIDVSGPVSIESVLGAIDRQRQDADQENAKREAERAQNADWSAARRVPGFGEETKTANITGFGAGDSGSASSVASEEVSESVRAQVDRVLSQYDPNKDGVLDAGEIQNTPWGQPSPQESDTNGDGRLSREELLERYRRRERDSERFNGDDRDRGRDRDNDSNSNESRERRGREERRESNNERPAEPANSAATNNDAKPESAPRSSTRRSSNEERIGNYVQDILRQYDSNNNGSIDGDEKSNMRSAPNESADADKNGSLSRDELVTYYGGGYKEPSSSGQSEPTKTDEKKPEAQDDNSRSERRRQRESSRSSDGPSGDRPIKMHEFTDNWTEEKLAEFRRLDTNGDGVISVEEFRRRD